MENEIKVGEYCRTRKGIIGILKQQFIFGHGVNYPEPQEWVIDINGKQYVTTECDVDFDNIVKHSPNLIDIIEVNDICIMSYNGIVFQKFVSRDDIVALKLKEYKLLEILTKEQFESISYKVTKM